MSKTDDKPCTKHLEFIKGDFTSPVLGNVWLGRRAHVPNQTADTFIKQGYAFDLALGTVDEQLAAREKEKDALLPEMTEEQKKAKAEADRKARDEFNKKTNEINDRLKAAMKTLGATDVEAVDHDDDGLPLVFELTDDAGAAIAGGSLEEIEAKAKEKAENPGENEDSDGESDDDSDEDDEESEDETGENTGEKQTESAQKEAKNGVNQGKKGNNKTGKKR